MEYPIKFTERDFTEQGRSKIYNLCNDLKTDINNSQDSPEEKTQSINQLNNFINKYKTQLTIRSQ